MTSETASPPDVGGTGAAQAIPAAARPDSRSPQLAALKAFGALMLRDLRVTTNERGRFFIRTLSQPLLLVFVFTYVFPTIGQGIRGQAAGDTTFTTVLVPGVLAITVFIRGIQTVALPLVQEFSYTREIEDRVLAPLPVWAVGLQKIVAGTLQGVVAVLLVFPIAAVLPAEPVELSFNWPVLVALVLLGSFVASAFGLVLGTFVEPRQVSMMFSVIILPLTFLGATYYPWAALSPIRWLQVATLANPMVYVSEGFRLALTPQLEHMSAWAIFAALLLLTVVVGYAGIKGFERRVLS